MTFYNNKFARGCASKEKTASTNNREFTRTTENSARK
jgi:hypothetical protein